MKKCFFVLSYVLGWCLLMALLCSCADELSSLMEGLRRDQYNGLCFSETWLEQNEEKKASFAVSLAYERIDVPMAELGRSELEEASEIIFTEDDETLSGKQFGKMSDGQLATINIMAAKKLAEDLKVPAFISIGIDYGNTKSVVTGESERQIYLPVSLIFYGDGNKELARVTDEPWYFQQATATPPPAEPTYSVKEYVNTNLVDGTKTEYRTFVIKRLDTGEKWTKELVTAESGSAIGRNVNGITLPATSTRYEDTDFEAPGSGVEEDGVFVVTTENHVYRRDTHYRGEISDNLTSENEILVTTRSLHFEDPKTRWTFNKTFKQKVVITSGAITEVTNGETFSEQGYDYQVKATHPITFTCYLLVDGEESEFFSSVAENHLNVRL